MIKRPPHFLHLGYLFALGLCLRLTYYFVAVGNVGFDQFWRTAPDTGVYWEAATRVVSGLPFKMCEMLWVGPGYILTLAGLQALFGSNPLYAILWNILLGSLAPILVYLFASQLTGSKTVALIAGTISAISLTSVTLSCLILTDQPAFTFFAACLAAYTYAFRKASLKWFVLAAVLGSLSAFIRSAGQYWALIFLLIPVLLPLQPGFGSRLKMILRAGSTGVVMLIAVLGWSTYNYVEHDTFSFATSGTLVARSCLVPQVIAAHTPGVKIVDLRTQVEIEDGHASDSCYLEYGKARKRVGEMFRAHPDWMIGAVLHNVSENFRAPNDIFYDQMLQIRWFSTFWNRSIYEWLGYLIAAISLIGLVFLVIDRNYLAWLVLGAGYGFFTLITGFSYWQGSRLHYQAEVAWAVLFAYALWRMVRRRKTTA